MSETVPPYGSEPRSVALPGGAKLEESGGKIWLSVPGDRGMMLGQFATWARKVLDESPAHVPEAVTAEPFVPVGFAVDGSVEFRVHWDPDRHELNVFLHGRHSGRLLVLPRSEGSVSIMRTRAARPGVRGGEADG